MSRIPSYTPDPTDFLGYTTVLYGTSKTGKSVIIMDLLHCLKPHCPNIVVYCPTDATNRAYSGHRADGSDRVLPLPLIHQNFTTDNLKTLWDRQVAISSAAAIGNNYTHLSNICKKLAGGKYADIVDKFSAKLNAVDPNNANLYKKTETAIISYFKKFINENVLTPDIKLTGDEFQTVANMNINPNLVVVFDDCSDIIKATGKSEYWDKIFFQGRHNNLTVIMAVHDDTIFQPRHKKAAFISIYTSRVAADTYFQRGSNNIPTPRKREIASFTTYAFGDLRNHPYRKLIYRREDDDFLTYTATLRAGFKFGSDELYELMQIVQTNNNTIPNNQFSHLFNL